MREPRRDGDGAPTLVVRPPHKKTQAEGKGMKHKVLRIIVAFMFVYPGTEVTVGGWIVIGERGEGVKAGYVSSGFLAVHFTFLGLYDARGCV